MGDVKSDSGTREIGEMEVTIRNRRTGEIKHQETFAVIEEDDK